ncbi:hypothetical protein Tco_1060255 [Tanacetum coccineum]
MESVRKSIDERALHKREYDSRVNERQMQTTEGKVDMSKALDVSLVDTKSRGIESEKQDTSSRSENDINVDDADIRSIYNEEPMAEVQLTADHNVYATGQQHTQQPEFSNEGEVDHNAEQSHDIRHLRAKSTDNQITELSNQSLNFENICLKKTVAQFQKDFSKLEAHCINLELQLPNNVLKSGQHGQFLKDKTKTIEHTTSLIAQNAEFKAQLQEKGFAIAALKNELRKLTGNSVNTKFEKPDWGNQFYIHSETNQLEGESAFAKPHYVIAPSSSKNSSKSVSTSTLKETYGLNDMIHKYYLQDAREKTQESGMNSRPNVMPSDRSQSTDNGSKPKPKINNQKSRNWHASKTSYVTTKTVPIAEHSRNSRNFSDSKHFVCSTCQKCVFHANHDACETKFLNEVNLLVIVPSHKTTTRYKPVDQISIAKKQDRQIPTRQRFRLERYSPLAQPSASTSINVKEEQTLDLSVGTPFYLKNERIKAWIKENMISSRPRVNIKQLCGRREQASMVGPHRAGAESDSLPYAHIQDLMTYIWHQDLRIKKAKIHAKTKTSANSDIQDLPYRYQEFQDKDVKGDC